MKRIVFKNCLTILLISIILVSILFVLFKIDVDTQNRYFENTNINFIGKITDIKKTNNHGFNIITLDVIKSNVMNYNPKEVYYYCLIKDKKAKIFENYSDCFVGDTIEIDLKSRKLTHFKNNCKKEIPISLETSTNTSDVLKW